MSTHGSRNEGRSLPRTIDPKGAGTASGNNTTAIERMDSYIATQIAPFMKNIQQFVEQQANHITDLQEKNNDLNKQIGVLTTRIADHKHVLDGLEAGGNPTANADLIESETSKVRSELMAKLDDVNAQVKHMISASNGLESRQTNLEKCSATKLDFEEMRKEVDRTSTSTSSQSTLISQVKMLSTQVTDLRGKLNAVKSPPIDDIVATASDNATRAAVSAAQSEVTALKNDLIVKMAAFETIMKAQVATVNFTDQSDVDSTDQTVVDSADQSQNDDSSESDGVIVEAAPAQIKPSPKKAVTKRTSAKKKGGRRK